MVITGKGYGMTNIVALDRTGAILMERTVEVQGPQNVVVVYRGVERETYELHAGMLAPAHARRRQAVLRGHRRARSPPATRSPPAPRQSR